MFKFVECSGKEAQLKWREVERIARQSRMNILSSDCHRWIMVSCKYNNKLAAFAGLTCYHGSWCLRACAVDKIYRGLGLQRRLIRHRIRILESLNKNKCNVWVSPENPYSLNNVIEEGFRFAKEKPRVIHGIKYVKLTKRF